MSPRFKQVASVFHEEQNFISPKQKIRKSIKKGGSTHDSTYPRSIKEVMANDSEERPVERARKAKPTRAAADVQATSLPDPIPAGDLTLNSHFKPTTTLPPTATPIFISPAVTVDSVAELPPVVHKTTTIWIYPSSSAAALPSPASHATGHSGSSSAVHLPAFVIVLIAVGSCGLCLVILFLLKCVCCKRSYSGPPTPSNPILQESPLFGGKERFSRGHWQESAGNLAYSPNKIGGVSFGLGKGNAWRPLSGGNSKDMSKTNEKILSSGLAPSVSKKPVPMPYSPGSVYTVALPPNFDVGVALDHPVPDLPSVGTQPLKVKDKTIEKKRRSITDNMYGGVEISSPTFTESTFAYQTPRPAPTPGKPKPALKPPRERGQGPYRKNSTSQATVTRKASRSEKEEPFMYAIPIVKSQERRDRDTKALTSALGLGSPPPLSSCFSPVSLYPDDSLSIAYGRPTSEMPSPTGTHAALGSLMLQDFPSTATFASMRTGDPFAGGETKKKGMQSRSDKPPRVPSPPPLPSLSQMALANADPDYKSPTYSIYGLYEAQRKSKMSLGD